MGNQPSSGSSSSSSSSNSNKHAKKFTRKEEVVHKNSNASVNLSVVKCDNEPLYRLNASGDFEMVQNSTRSYGESESRDNVFGNSGSSDKACSSDLSA